LLAPSFGEAPSISAKRWTISHIPLKLRALSACRRKGTRTVAKRVLLLNGPNLNLLGTREPERYGNVALGDIEARLAEQAKARGAALDAFQSNSEAELVGRIQQAAREGVDFILINAAGFTHTSVALRDALAAVRIPFVEIHVTNVHARERFRWHSYLSELAAGVVSGLGPKGYELALAYALEFEAKG
jgi:3-dehydroquinate dehydratase-2